MQRRAGERGGAGLARTGRGAPCVPRRRAGRPLSDDRRRSGLSARRLWHGLRGDRRGLSRRARGRCMIASRSYPLKRLFDLFVSAGVLVAAWQMLLGSMPAVWMQDFRAEEKKAEL